MVGEQEKTHPVLLTAEEVATEYLRWRPEYFRWQFRKGRLPGFPDAVRVGAQRRWFAEEVLNWLEKNREDRPSSSPRVLGKGGK